jgi:hypothetical protein
MSTKKPSSGTQETQPITLVVIDPTQTLDVEQMKKIDSMVEKAGALHLEIDTEQAKTAIKIVWQGCHLYLAAEALSAIQDRTIRGEIYEGLLKKYGVARVTANQRILLVKRMLERRVVSRGVLFGAEDNVEGSAKLLTLIDKACGEKRGVELQREYGIRQPLKDTKETPPKGLLAPVQKIEGAAKSIKSLLERMEKYLSDLEVTEEIKTRLLQSESELSKAFIRFRRALSDQNAYVGPSVPPEALAAINPPSEVEAI